MGMFDTVFAPCPECGKLLGFQSKEGECDLKKYKHTSVPAEIAADLTGEHYDGEPYNLENCCGKQFRLKAIVSRVSMTIEEWPIDNEEWPIDKKEWD